MNRDPRLASRSFKKIYLAIALLALSSAAIVAAAQQLPDRFRSASDDDAKFDVLAAAPEAGFTVASTAVEALSAGPRDVRATSGKVSETTPAHHRVPVVTDWSTKHVVFAKPRTAKDAARLEHNTRYKMQVARRNAPTFRKLPDAPVESSDLLDRFRNRVPDPRSRPAKADPIHRDWSVNLNGSVADQTPTPNVGASQFPAKFSFDLTAPPDCQNDFVVYNTNTSLLVAFNNLYSGTDPASGQPNGYCTDGDGHPLSAPTVMWAYNVNEYSDGVTTTSVTLSEDGTQVAFVESSPTNGAVLHIVKWHAGDGTITSPMPLANTAQDVTGQPTVWADNCGGTNLACMWSVPFSPDWYYHAGGGDVSPRRSGAFSRKPSPNAVIQRNYAPNDTNSAPYYDYDADVIYVGTDSANVHQFINIFNGGASAGPSENTGGYGVTGWPLYVNYTARPAITGPIEDEASGRIFVSDVNGFLLTIETNTVPGIAGACSGQSGPIYRYPCLAERYYAAGTNGVPDPPVVDSSLGTVMVFGGANELIGDPLDGDAFAAQSRTTASCVCGDGEEADGSFVFADFGPVVAGSGVPMHAGDFDNNYYNSDTPGGPVAGFMYVCAIDPNGNSGGGNTALRQISFDSTTGLISGVSAAYLPVALDYYDICSPVTEVYNTNTNTDLVFFSVESHSYACNADPLTGTGVWPASAPGGGCVMSVDVTNTSDLSTFFPAGFAAASPEDGGTSGIIVDNISSDAQASSIYFTPLGDPTADPAGDCTYIGCAVKATQVGLQ